MKDRKNIWTHHLNKMSLILFVSVLVVFIPIYSHAIDRINPSVDLKYLGAFRVPTDSSSNYSWGWLSEHGLSFNPNGNSGSGSLISPPMSVESNDMFAKITEFSIPTPVISSSKSLSDLPVASTLNDWTDITQGKYNQGQSEELLTNAIVVPAQGSQTKNKLYWMTSDWYSPPTNFPTIGMSDLDFSTPNASGPWIITGDWVENSGSIPSGKTSQYIFNIPESWANTYMPGYIIGVGQNKPNGDGSRGATIYAVKAWTTDSPAWTAYPYGSTGSVPSDALIDSKQLLCPGMDVSHRRNYDGSLWDDFSYSDGQNAAVWIDNTTNGAIIFSGEVAYAPAKDTGDCSLEDGGFCEYYKDENPPGMGLPVKCGYSPCAASPDSCSDSGDYRGEPYIRGLWFYAIDDITAVAQGKKQPWEPQPYVFFNLENYFFSQSTCRHIGGIAYDSTNKRIYVAELGVDTTVSRYDKMPIIHVFQVNDSGLPADTKQPSSVNLSCSKYDDYIELSWNAASDNYGPILYIIHRNGKAAAVTTQTTFQDYGFSSYPSPYTYQVEIRDGVNNISFSNETSPGLSNSDSSSTETTSDLPPDAPSGVNVLVE